MLLFLNVIYVLVAIAMVALILMQRGAGAQAGSGFGSGASGTVFGSRGASNFLSKSTKWLAIVFFAISLFMAWNASKGAQVQATTATEQPKGGIMAQIPTAAPAKSEAAPAVVPSAPASAVPTAPANVAPATEVPAAPASQQPAPAPAPTGG
ncbi:preprotein translocase subunit SecG [Lysobacter fragariae]